MTYNEEMVALDKFIRELIAADGETRLPSASDVVSMVGILRRYADHHSWDWKILLERDVENQEQEKYGY